LSIEVLDSLRAAVFAFIGEAPFLEVGPHGPFARRSGDRGRTDEGAGDAERVAR
jgi:hypothetical protein